MDKKAVVVAVPPSVKNYICQIWRYSKENKCGGITNKFIAGYQGVV